MASRRYRESNIEILRVIAAMGVVSLHFNNESMGGGFRFVEEGSLNQLILIFIETLFICAVNLFVLVTGYFMIKSEKRDLLKPLEFVLEVVFFKGVFYFVGIFDGSYTFNVKGFFVQLVPTNWYVMVYVGLYLISPYLNLVWKKINQNNRKYLIVSTLIAFSIWPMICDVLQWWALVNTRGLNTIGLEGDGSGYTIVNFVLVYFIGCALYDWKNVHKLHKWKIFLLLLINIGLIYGWVYLDRHITGKSLYTTRAWVYLNPLVILEAVLVFLLFININMGSRAIINEIAKASFTTYIIHIPLLKYLEVEKFVTGRVRYLLLYLVISVVTIYLIGIGCYYLHRIFEYPVHRFLDKHWKRGRFFGQFD